ncbi:MAG: hypothetical protein P8Y68_10140 [Anaerolineales bacterium]|jgi:hypothetical protein
METKKEIYQHKVEAKIDQVNAKIDSYLAKFDETKADTKLEIKNQLDDLTNQRETVERKFEEMRNAGQDAWSDMRSGLDDAIEELETSYNKAVEKMAEVTQ